MVEMKVLMRLSHLLPHLHHRPARPEGVEERSRGDEGTWVMMMWCMLMIRADCGRQGAMDSEQSMCAQGEEQRGGVEHARGGAEGRSRGEEQRGGVEHVRGGVEGRSRGEE